MLFVEFPSEFSICKLKLLYSELVYNEDDNTIEFPYSETFEVTLVNSINNARQTLSLGELKRVYLEPTSDDFCFISNMNILCYSSGDYYVVISRLGCIAKGLMTCLDASAFRCDFRGCRLDDLLVGYHLKNSIIYYGDLLVNERDVLGLSTSGNILVTSSFKYPVTGIRFLKVTVYNKGREVFTKEVYMDDLSEKDVIKIIKDTDILLFNKLNNLLKED